MRTVLAWCLNGCYLLVLALVMPWWLWRRWWRGKVSAPWWPRLTGAAPLRDPASPCLLWFHAVSVGEVTALRTLIGELRRRRPQAEIVISTTTATGYEIAQQRYPDCKVCWSPLDFSWAVNRALRRAQPDLLILCELEIWPNWIAAAERQQIPVAVVNARLAARSFRNYQRWRWFLQPTFQRLALVACQTPLDAERFQALGVAEATCQVTGSMKFDGAETDRHHPRTVELRQLAQIGDQDVVWLVGSTSAPEEELALGAFRELAPHFPHLRLIVVPRHPERFSPVAELIAACNYPWCRRSQLGIVAGAGGVTGADAGSDSGGQAAPWRILLVDTLGELGGWWGTAQIGYVGGSMGPREGQNMIEPAAYGVAICFGPRTKNFRDVVEQLRRAQAAVVVENQAEMTEFVRRCLQDKTRRQQWAHQAQSVVLQNLGATPKTADCLEQLLKGLRQAGRLSHRPHAPYSKKLVRGRRIGPTRG